MREMLVLGGSHPDELRALQLALDLMMRRRPNVHADVVNVLGILIGQRWVHKNITYCYPGKRGSAVYEEHRASEIVTRSHGYYGVIDWHNMNGYGRDTAMIDRKNGVSPLMLGFLGKLGISNLIATDNMGLQQCVPNTMLVETLATNPHSQDEEIRNALGQLANDKFPPTARAKDFRWFKLLESAHVDTFNPFTLGGKERESLFEGVRINHALPGEYAKNFEYSVPLHLMSWREDGPNEKGYWGELITPTESPDDSRWPETLNCPDQLPRVR
jgi:hypothetical protein